MTNVKTAAKQIKFSAAWNASLGVQLCRLFKTVSAKNLSGGVKTDSYTSASWQRKKLKLSEAQLTPLSLFFAGQLQLNVTYGLRMAHGQQLIPNTTQDAFSPGRLCCVSHCKDFLRPEDYAILIRHSMASKAFRLEIECSSQYQSSHYKPS